MNKSRKVQKTGGSTLAVSLPKKWTQGRIKKGDSVQLYQKGDELILRPEKLAESNNKVEVNYEGDSDLLLRKSLALFLDDVDILKVEGSEVAKDRDEIKSKIKSRIIGFEVVEETGHSITFQSYLDYKNTSFQETLERISSLLISMFEDLLQSHEEKEILKDIDNREEEVDRFYILGSRQLSSAASGLYRAEDDGDYRSLGEFVEYRVIIENLEQIGDHLTLIADCLADLIACPPDLEKLLQYGEQSFQVFQKAVEAIKNKDEDLANEVVEEARAKELEGLPVLKDSHCQLNVERIRESLNLINEYSASLGEMLINVATKSDSGSR